MAGCAAPQKLASSSSPPPASPSAASSPSPSPSPIAPLAIASVAFHAGEIGFAYAPVMATANGGVPPYRWAVTAGSFPGGLVMDAIGATEQTTAKFHVFPHIAFTGALAANCSGGGTWGTGCTTQPALPYTLGTPGLALPPVKFSVISGPPLPKDVKFTAQNGTVTGIFPGPDLPVHWI